MSNDMPKQRANVLVEDSGDEAMLYHPDSDELHVLNATAQLIWDLCDGKHAVVQIVEAVRTQFDVPSTVDVQGDVENTLAELNAKGLLE